MFNPLEKVYMRAKKQLIAAMFALALAGAPVVRAQSEASAISAVSALPVASIVVDASAAAGALLVVPFFLSATGAVFAVQAVQATAVSTVYALERLTDGARVSVQVAGRGINNVSVAAGSIVTVSVVGAGVILSAAGEAIAFIPNAAGRALLFNERLTY
jgi:hypothetical protein